MSYHLKKNREGFPLGLTVITKEDEKEDNTRIRFSILRLDQGEVYKKRSTMEIAILQLSGEIEHDGIRNRRRSLFDEPPFAIHACHEKEIKITAITETELAIFETPNDKEFPTVIYQKTENEHRGKGFVDDASLRFVRTIFDGSHSHPNTELVLGEVVNFPGRWSSYPPHHHPQPELYHYRFTDPRGYGHAELDDEIYKVKQYDTIKILDEKDHAQCSAPGYGMYYIWVIRHLENNRYTIPEFTEDHRWTMSENATFWNPKQEALV